MKREDCSKNINKSKKSIRRLIQERRDCMSAGLIKVKSTAIAEKFFCLHQYRISDTILAYYPFRSELDTRIIIKKSLVHGKKIALPRVNTKKMEFFYIKNLSEDLETGSYGIMEPIPSICERAFPEDIDIVIVPGVGFDSGMNRLGYGGGFYDRFLKELPGQASKISLAFDIQVMEHIPVSEHDMKVDIIITESCIYNIKDIKG
jgi:5-formyltetrahydrofolate cyclo-ligase